MKQRWNALLCILLLSLTLLSSCSAISAITGPTPRSKAAKEQDSTSSSQTQAVPEEIRVMALKGPTAMGMVQLMNQADTNQLSEYPYEFSILSSPDEIPPLIAQGKVDIAAVPANLAAVLYQKTEGAVQVLAINTLGVLSILERGESIQSIEDLRGKTIYASGKGNTPEYVLRYILKSHQINPDTDVTIEWKSEHTECLAALTTQEDGIAMLPQPFATTAQLKDSQIRIAIDLTQAWDQIQQTQEHPSALVTGVVLARKDFIEEFPQAVEDFMDHYRNSVQFVQNNIPEASKLIDAYEIVPQEVAQAALPYCHIVLISGQEMEQKLSGYLQVLFEEHPQSVGGAMPDAQFYYIPSNT